MLVVFDKKGTVYFAGTGFSEPEGIPYLNIDIPEGKYFKGIDVSGKTPAAIFEDIPKPEIELLKERVHELEKTQNALLGVE